jgi:ketosteroid isomerase-like protein
VGRQLRYSCRMERHPQIERLYAAFNDRDLDALLGALAENVHWSNGWEGGWLDGRSAVRDYWERQWRAIDPTVEPVESLERADGTIAVRVHQVVRQKDGTVIADQEVWHVYRFDGISIAGMVIEEPPAERPRR